VNAQENITVSGGTLSGIDGAVSYSVGQIFYITYSGAKGSITQGVQQPYEISPISSINEFDGIDLICLAYPNPTSDLLFLQIENKDTNDFIFQLIDIHGKILDNQYVTCDNFTISMSGYESGTYFFKLLIKSQEVKVFKIVKK
jgi:hypothetical protein